RRSQVRSRGITLGLALAVVAFALVAQRRYAATAQETAQARATATRSQEIRLVEIASDPNGPTGIAHHQPSNSLLLSSEAGLELLGTAGARAQLSRLGAHGGALATARETRNGFIAGDVFAGSDEPGAIIRLSSTALPGASAKLRGADSQGSWAVL